MLRFDPVKTLNSMEYMFLKPDPAFLAFLDHFITRF